MTIQHTVLTSSQVHEPKHITTSSISDTGKVITPSGSAGGTSELRKLLHTEITGRTTELVAVIEDVSTAGDVYLISPFDGVITRMQLVIDGAVATADNDVTLHVGATTVATITVVFTGSAAADTYNQLISSSNSVTDGQVIKITTAGDSTNTVKATVILSLNEE